MEQIVEYFDIMDQLHDDNIYECEARIKGFFVNDSSCRRFIKRYEDYIECNLYTQQKKKQSSTVSYRKRDNVTICKSSLFRKICKEYWFSMHISSEVPIKYNTDNLFRNTTVEDVYRWTLIQNNNIIEIGYTSTYDIWWVEVEKTTRSTPELFLNTIISIIKELQDSEHFLSYSSYVATIRVKYPIAKPVTLTYKNISMLRQCKWISQKYDGIRVFLIIRLGRVIERDLKDNMRIISSESTDDILTVLDCEKVGNIYYILDVIIYKGRLITNKPTHIRLEYRSRYINKNIKIKNFYPFESIDQVGILLDNSDVSLDGIIFMADKYDSILFKWKPINTVDLLVTRKYLVTSDRTKIALNDRSDLIIGNIYEFTCVDKTLVPYRIRPDKPFPNSEKIFEANIKNAIPLSFFDGSSSFFMRKYHNSVKRELLKLLPISRNKTLIDIGTGQGGDISKWKQLNYTTVYSIEPDDGAYQESLKRSNFSIRIPNKLRDVHDFDQKVDMVAAFFCMNLFNNKDVMALKDILFASKPKYFVGICMTSVEEHDNICFKTDVLNDKYVITIKETRITSLFERLVDIKKLSNMLQTINYKLVLFENLDKGKLLSRHEKLLSKMYAQFVYESV